MDARKKNQILRLVLFSTGVVDLFTAIALFFPILDLPLPGYGAYTREIAFVAGGWGIAALTFGIGRIWASYKPAFHRMMAVLGLIEGFILTLFCLINVFFLEISLLQAMLPLAVGGVFGILYFVALYIPWRIDRPNHRRKN